VERFTLANGAPVSLFAMGAWCLMCVVSGVFLVRGAEVPSAMVHYVLAAGLLWSSWGFHVLANLHRDRARMWRALERAAFRECVRVLLAKEGLDTPAVRAAVEADERPQVIALARAEHARLLGRRPW
jgi:hypothetical protein